jgi:hypothetical protein
MKAPIPGIAGVYIENPVAPGREAEEATGVCSVRLVGGVGGRAGLLRERRDLERAA